MKRTYQPSKVRRARTHGFLTRMKTRGGRAVINARRLPIREVTRRWSRGKRKDFPCVLLPDVLLGG